MNLPNSWPDFCCVQTPKALSPCGKCQGCQLFSASSHPDFHQVMSEKQIGVDAIREAINKLVGTAQLSGNKVLVIHDANRMTDSAANALLKTLEEPTKHTYLILQCDSLQGMLPTILSRCEKVNLNPPDSHACIEWLTAQGMANVSFNLVKLYANAPLRILRSQSDTSAFDFKAFLDGLIQLQKHQVSSIELTQKWQDNLEQVVEWTQFIVADQIKKHVNNDALWMSRERLLKVGQVLTHPGLNKTVLLAGVLENIYQLPPINLEDYNLAG